MQSSSLMSYPHHASLRWRRMVASTPYGACAPVMGQSRSAARRIYLLYKLRHDILATSVHLSRPYRPGTRGCRETIRWTTTPCLCICCLLMPPFLQLLQPFYAPLG